MTIGEASKRAYDQRVHSDDEVQALVNEIFENKSCDGCVHHLSANGNIPLSCMDCSRFYGDGFEEIKK